jgi:hypothetical protein
MFLRGFERDGARISGFFKLKKIRTGKNIVLFFYFISKLALTVTMTSLLMEEVSYIP